jgi:NADH:quinone reductase (non-electrogenic)
MARPRVVIIGGGFGGFTAARRLKRAPVDLTLVDRTNHHLFQPLLYQVASTTLAPSDIAVPIRWMLRNQRNTTVLLGDATCIDTARRRVVLDNGDTELPYDYLIVATGTRHSYFGHPEWEELAPGLKSIEDALNIRNRFLLAFEEAERAKDDATRQALQTFVIVGGGPTGVELAGTIPPIAKIAFRKDFRHIDTRRTRVVLLEGLDRVLPSFPESLSAHARRDLEKLGVEVHTGKLVTRIEPDAVYVGAEKFPAYTVFWAAGNAASPLARTLGVPLDSAGRVMVERDLSVPGHTEVFVVGDLAAVVRDDRGTLVPGVAPAANQEGWVAAGNILAAIAGKPRKEFKYWNKGDLATIGRHRAVANFGFLKVTGFLAWFLWLFIHILYLAGFRNRLTVFVQWTYAYLTYQRGMRLITNYARVTRGTPLVGGVTSASGAAAVDGMGVGTSRAGEPADGVPATAEAGSGVVSGRT